MSWFDLKDRMGAAQRFDAEDEAREAIQSWRKMTDPSVKWRVTHVEIVREENRRITTETFIAVD